MAYIYCITNLINKKQYIGKTTTSITKRFKEHCQDYIRRKNEHRPLYAAMRKYGIENFIVEQLIECEPDELSSYEQMYIDKLNTYKQGYNATKGGDGKLLFDYKEIVNLYAQVQNIVQVARTLHCCYDTVFKVIHSYNIEIHAPYSGNCQKPKKVYQFLPNVEQPIQKFNSIAEAAQWVVNNGYAKTYNGGVRQKISLCCQNKQKTAYTYKWKFE